MGVGGALIMPTTLSILVNVFGDSGERAKAIAVWTAASGLGIALGHPVYVTAIDAARNTVHVGPKEALLQRTLVAREVNWIATDDAARPAPPPPRRVPGQGALQHGAGAGHSVADRR